ncbi:MAG: hypothetical protein GY928_01985 [Colwellia sp.]|nr:hypothetical protein [Colwellia sp.]
MIIGRALGLVFDGMTLDSPAGTIDVQNNMGNQDALNKFIAESDRKRALKFPLIFYVIAPTKELGNYRYCDTDLIIMMNTKEQLLYKDRADKTYIDYIEPIYDQVKTLLNQNIYITDLSERIDRYSYTDVPNYGINNESTAPVSKVQDKSAITDYVDARIIKLRLKINTNCLIP